MLRNILLGIFLLSIVFSCSNEPETPVTTDFELTQLLKQSGDGSLDFFKMPESQDLQNIPQDPNNPLSDSKVELGKLLFHEPGLSVESNFPGSMMTYSCASCHHAKAGFQANVPQGIGDGGIGFGLRGEARIIDPGVDPALIDVQSIRSPSALNVAFQTNMLWNGQFGATSVNSSTNHLWTIGSPKEVNRLGFEGVETQAIAGLSVHRFGLGLSLDLINNTDYKNMTIGF